jgi:hypothetical protein
MSERISATSTVIAASSISFLLQLLHRCRLRCGEWSEVFAGGVRMPGETGIRCIPCALRVADARLEAGCEATLPVTTRLTGRRAGDATYSTYSIARITTRGTAKKMGTLETFIALGTLWTLGTLGTLGIERL